MVLAGLLGWALAGAARAERVEGVVVAINAKNVVIRTAEGRRITLTPTVRPRLRKGDSVVSEDAALRVLEPGRQVAGRVRSLNPGRRELTLDTSAGPVKVHVLAGTVLFKENLPGNWLELHQGESVAATGQTAPDGLTAGVLFDALSFVVHELEPTHGALQAQGMINGVNAASPVDGTLTLGSVSLRYDRQTRWQLGARFTGPQDFQGVEALVFGSPGQARMVVSRRAVPFVFETLLGQ